MNPPDLVQRCMAHVAEMCGALTCPTCKGTEFVYNRPIDAHEVASIAGGQAVRSKAVVVLFPVACQHCGFTMLFSGDAILKDPT